jgi:hypothetical protein
VAPGFFPHDHRIVRTQSVGSTSTRPLFPPGRGAGRGSPGLAARLRVVAGGRLLPVRRPGPCRLDGAAAPSFPAERPPTWRCSGRAARIPRHLGLMAARLSARSLCPIRSRVSLGVFVSQRGCCVAPDKGSDKGSTTFDSVRNHRMLWSGPQATTTCRGLVVPHTGFEPVISALRGRCPRPLDECGTRPTGGCPGRRMIPTGTPRRHRAEGGKPYSRLTSRKPRTASATCW